jgi:hypothetical protein
MAQPQEQIDKYWEEVMDLTERLAAAAVRLFREKGCRNLEAILPGTGMSGMDLVEKTIEDLLTHGHWVPASGGKDPFPLAYRAMYRDFLDLTNLKEFQTTTISESLDSDVGQVAVKLPAIDQESSELWVNSLSRHLKNDPLAIAYLRVWLVEGYETIADQAKQMGVEEQDVINIRRRLAEKVHLWQKLLRRKNRQ